MKRLILILITLLITTVGFAQKEVSYYGYIPLKTYHFVRDKATMNDLADNEGGNVGLIIGRRVTQSETLYTEKQFGALRNSYGDLSFVLQQGVGTKVIGLDVGIAVGLITGYQRLYEINKAIKQMPGILQNNGMIVTAVLNVAPSKGFRVGDVELKPMILLTPFYINAGLLIDLK
jgi:hypothetical protein